MSRWSPVYVPEIETGRHVKNNACTVEIKIKWTIRKHMTYENTYREDNTYFLLSNLLNPKNIIECTYLYKFIRDALEIRNTS